MGRRRPARRATHDETPVQKAAVAARVAVAFAEGHELIDFGGREVFAVVPHCVQCLKR
jgi:hypothetical protein